MKIAKEIFIMALLLMIVVFMIGLVFYEYMPNNKIVPEASSYSADSSTTSVLQEIAASSSDYEDGSSDGVEDRLLQSYSIGQDDLNRAASRHSYTSGKTDPFAAYIEPNTNTTGNNVVNGTNTTQQSTTAPQKAAQGSVNNNQSGGTSTQKNSSTGSFFEKPNSK